MPTNYSAFVLSGPEIAIGTVVDRVVGRIRHIGRVVGSEVDVVGNVVMWFDIEFIRFPATQIDRDILQIACKIEVGTAIGCYDRVTGNVNRQGGLPSDGSSSVAAWEVGHGKVVGLVAVLVIAQ